MRIVVNCCLAAVFLLLAGFADAGTGPAWKQFKQKDGVTLYKRSFPDSPILEVMGVVTLHAAPEVVEAIIRDIPAYPEFMHNCIEGRALKQYDDENIVILNVTKMPWPVATREVVVRTRVKKDFAKGRFEVALVGLPKGESESWLPAGNGRVRMHDLTGTFIVQLVGRTECRMTYIVHADPSGLPSMLVNIFVDDNPLETLRGIRRMTAKPKYVELGRKSRYLGEIEKYFAANKK